MRQRTAVKRAALALLATALLLGSACDDKTTAPPPADSGRHDLRSDRGNPDLATPDLGRPDLRPDSAADLPTADLRPADLPVTPDVLPRDRGVDAPNIVVLGNILCSDPGALQGGPTEDGHLSAVRLTPKFYPFTVNKVRYALMPSPASAPNTCATGIDHRVDIFITSAIAPAATPTILRSIKVPRTADGTTIRVFTHDVTPPLVLAQGDHLYVAVQMRHTSAGEQLCLRACFPATAPKDRDYWSNAALPPYPWVQLQSFGFVAQSSTQALGF